MSDPVFLSIVFLVSSIFIFAIGCSAGYMFCKMQYTGREKITPNMMPAQPPIFPPAANKSFKILDEISPFAPKPKVQPGVMAPARPTPTAKPIKPRPTTWESDSKPAPKPEAKKPDAPKVEVPKSEPKPDPNWSDIKTAANGQLPPIDWGNNK